AKAFRHPQWVLTMCGWNRVAAWRGTWENQRERQRRREISRWTSCATSTSGGPVSATWQPPPASHTDPFTACCASRVPRCAAAAALTTPRGPGNPCEPGHHPLAGGTSRRNLGPLFALALRSRPRIIAAHGVLYQVEDRGKS